MMRGWIEAGIYVSVVVFCLGAALAVFGVPQATPTALMITGVIGALITGILFLIWMAVRGIRATMNGDE